MNLTWKVRTLITLGLFALPVGVVTTAPAVAQPQQLVPPSQAITKGDSLVAKTISQPNYRNRAHEIVECDDSHPFLVLDKVSNNKSRLFRHATYNTGDNAALNFSESITPGPPLATTFKQAHLNIGITDSDVYAGHRSITIYCASTLKAAHQE